MVMENRPEPGGGVSAPSSQPAVPGEERPSGGPALRSRAPEGDAQTYLHPQTLARLGTLELRAKMIVEGVMSGMHRSPYHGFSVEFAQHRPYVAGDDIRHLDWKVYGRTDKLHLKQYQQETNLDLVVLVDSSGSMAYGSRLFAEASGTGQRTNPRGNVNWSKFDHATAVAAALSYMALRQGDRVGLGVFADEVRSMLKRSSAQGQWRQIIGVLSTSTVEKPTDVVRIADQAMAKLTNRCLIALISDLFVDPEQLRTALAHIRHRRHDVIVMQVIDRNERAFEFKDNAPFEGLEGEPRVRVDPRAIRAAYQQVFEEHLEAVEKVTRAFGFDYCRVHTHEWLGPPMAAFMARRGAQIKRSRFG